MRKFGKGLLCLFVLAVYLNIGWGIMEKIDLAIGATPAPNERVIGSAFWPVFVIFIALIWAMILIGNTIGLIATSVFKAKVYVAVFKFIFAGGMVEALGLGNLIGATLLVLCLVVVFKYLTSGEEFADYE